MPEISWHKQIKDLSAYKASLETDSWQILSSLDKSLCCCVRPPGRPDCRSCGRWKAKRAHCWQWTRSAVWLPGWPRDGWRLRRPSSWVPLP